MIIFRNLMNNVDNTAFSGGRTNFLALGGVCILIFTVLKRTRKAIVFKVALKHMNECSEILRILI